MEEKPSNSLTEALLYVFNDGNRFLGTRYILSNPPTKLNALLDSTFGIFKYIDLLYVIIMFLSILELI